MIDDTDDDGLKAHRKAYRRFSDAWKANRERFVEDLEFIAGEQWFADNKAQREQDGQPCLVVDKLSQYVRQVVNDSRQNRASIKVRPVDSDADPELAEVLQGLIRHIEDRSNADTAYDTALESAVKGGFGFIRILTEYSSQKTFDQEIVIKRVRNPLTVLFDPDCQESDGSDAKRVFIHERIDKDEFKEMYPDAELTDWVLDDEESGDWQGEDKITVSEVYWLEETERKVHLLEDGTKSDDEELAMAKADGVEPPPIKSTRTMKDVQLWWAKMSGHEFLEKPTKLPGRYIPVVPVWGNEYDIEGEVSYIGMIHSAMDAQRLYNYSRSAYAERVALTPKAPYIAAAGQIDNYADQWETANSNSHAVLVYDPQSIDGTVLPAPQRQPASDIPSGFQADMQISEHDIQSALGMYNASLGAQSNEKSGRAIMARQREGDTSTFHYHDNLSRAIRHCGQIIVDIAPHYYDTKRVVRILGVDGTSEMAELDPEQKTAVAKRGKASIYNLNIGQYDVSVSAGPSYNTRRQEAAEAMMQLTQANPQLFAIVGDLMVKSMDWPGAEEIADRLKIMLPPEIKQQEAAEEQDIPPEAQAIMQQAQQAIAEREQALQQAAEQMQQLTAQIAELQQAVDSKQMEAQIKAQELEIKNKEVDVKAYDAETKRAETAAKIAAEQQQQISHEALAQMIDNIHAMSAAISDRLDQADSVRAVIDTNL